MSSIDRYFSLYISHNIHVSLMVVCLYVTTVLEWGLPLLGAPIAIVFLGSFLSYSFIKKPVYFFSSLTRFYRLRGGGIYFLSALLFGGLLLNTAVPDKIIFFCAGCLVFFYVFPQNRYINLRRLSGIKIYIVSLSWVLITGVLPFENYDWSTPHYLYQLQRFLLIILATLPFELRDLKADDPRLKTLAQSLGFSGVQLLGYGLSFFIFLLSGALHYLYGVAAYSALVLLPFYLWSLSDIKRLSSPYFVSFWVEWIPFFGLIFLYFYR